jgi:hypothetical protein
MADGPPTWDHVVVPAPANKPAFEPTNVSVSLAQMDWLTFALTAQF